MKLKPNKLKLVVIFFFLSAACLQAQEISIIPKPMSVQQQQGTFLLTEKSTIGYSPELKELAQYLQGVLGQSTGWQLPIAEGKGKASLLLTLDKTAVKAEEGYRLEVNSKQVRVTAATRAGAFYGVQSLLQLFPADIYSAHPKPNVVWKATNVVITDAPDRPWRGMMLDVARYFYDKEFVKKFIDMMAMYKLNKLQFHLIDDSGWRIEIKKYPRLTEVGAYSGTKGNRTGGYYTQDEMKEILAYAALRNVDVIPEVEFPAHILSAVVAYPWLSCTGQQHELPTQHFISRDLLCAGKPTSIQFLSDVLDEMVNLFPSHYINIGGDEAVYDRWKECPDCQALMKREGLKDVSELQGYLVNVVSDMMKAKNRQVVGWEEIIRRGKVRNPVVALVWRNEADSIIATQTGHKAVLTPAKNMYFDFPEEGIPGEVKAATWLPPVSLYDCYSMPLNDYSESSTVIGVQGCFWGDQFIHGTKLQEIPLLDENRSERYAEYLVFPRLLAVSEVGWRKPSTRNFDDFTKRLAQHYARLDNKECYYRLPQPTIVREEKKANGNYVFTLAPSVPGSKILYTTNGEYPDSHAKEYTAPVEVSSKSDFHVITYINSRRYSLPIYFAPDYSAYEKFGTFTGEWNPLQVQTVPFVLKTEATGKIDGNGTYEVTYIHGKGSNALQLSKLQLLKREEVCAEAAIKGVSDEKATVLDDKTPTATFTLTLKNFEAGTPFYLHLQAMGVQGNDCSGLIFIRKIR